MRVEEMLVHDDEYSTKHVIIWEFPNKFYKTISYNNMTRMIKMI